MKKPNRVAKKAASVNSGRKRPRSIKLTQAKIIADLRCEIIESDALREQMSLILRRTADALHGGPLENGYWSWHNLPELAEELREEAGRPTFESLPWPPSRGVIHKWPVDTLSQTLDTHAGWWWRLLLWRNKWNRSSSRRTSA